MQPAARVPDVVGGTVASLRDICGTTASCSACSSGASSRPATRTAPLGFVWSLLRPLALLLVYYLAIGKFLGAERQIPDFAVYVFTGLTVWQLFAETVAVGHGLDRRQRGPGQEGLPAARGVPAQRRRLGAVQLRSSSSSCSARPPSCSGRFPTGERLAVPAPVAAARGRLRHGARRAALGGERLPARHPVPRRDRPASIAVLALAVVYSWELVQRRASGPRLSELYLLNPVTHGRPRHAARRSGSPARAARPRRPRLCGWASCSSSASSCSGWRSGSSPASRATSRRSCDGARTPPSSRSQGVSKRFVHPQGQVAQGAPGQRPPRPRRTRGLLGAARRRPRPSAGRHRRPDRARTARASRTLLKTIGGIIQPTSGHRRAGAAGWRRCSSSAPASTRT